MIDNGKKAVIHIAKAQVGMSNEEYRDLLGSFGVRSSKDLNNKTFTQVMGKFEKLGYKRKSKTGSNRKINNLPLTKKAMMKKIEAIILDMDLTWAYVDGMAKKQFKVEKVQWLNPPELHKILIMMVYHQNRQNKKLDCGKSNKNKGAV